MGLRAEPMPDTKHRQIQAAELCKQHLRQKYQDDLLFVEAFIAAMESKDENQHIFYWGEFTDSSWKNEEILLRLDEKFKKWRGP